VALKCLELTIRRSSAVAGDDKIMTPAVTDLLFKVLSSASQSSDSAQWDFPNQPEAVDFYLALSLLEVHSVHMMQSDHRSEWTDRYLPIVADILETSLRRRSDQFGDLECLALKLTMNMANNNPEAQEAFLGEGLLRDLAAAACSTFGVVLRSITADDFASATFDSLVVMLGVMINFCEHDPSAGRILVQEGSSPLETLIRIFLDYRATTSEVGGPPGWRKLHC